MQRFKSLLLMLVLLPGFLLLATVQPPTGSASEQEVTAVPGVWEIVPLASGKVMYTVDMLSPTNGWAGGSAGFILHYDGNGWWGVPTDWIVGVNELQMLSETEGWGVIFGGEIIRYDGASWTVVYEPPDVSDLNDIHMLSSTSGWTVGNGGVIFRYNGSSWNSVPSPVDTPLEGIDMWNASNGWAVGQGGVILRWNGAIWTGGVVLPGGIPFLDVDIAGPNDVWVVGGLGTIYHYNGSSWSQVDSPTDKTLLDVYMFDGSVEGWAVGMDGTIIYYDGTSWQLADSPTTQDLHAIDMLSPSDGWIAGNGWQMLHFGIPPDLSTSTKVVSSRTAEAGEQLTYTINVRNTGAEDAPSVVVSDTLDLGLVTYVPDSATTTQGTIQQPNPLVVDVGNLGGYTEVEITFQVTVKDQAASCWFVPNEAVIGMDGQQTVRVAVTRVGDCARIYVPLAMKNF